MLQSNGYAAELPELTSDNVIALKDDVRTRLVQAQAASTVTVQPYRIYQLGTVSQAVSVQLGQEGVESGYSVEYTFRFTAGSGCSVTLPSTCKYNGGQAPTLTAGHVYEYNIVDNLVVVGEFW